MRFAASPGFQDVMSTIGDVGVDYNQLSNMGQQSRSMQQQTAFDSESKLKSAENEARAMVEAAKYGAQAMRAQGQAAGNAAMVSGIASGISGIAGGLGGMGGGITSYDQIPSAGLTGAAAGGGPNAYFGTGGKYGTFQPGSFIDYNPAIG